MPLSRLTISCLTISILACTNSVTGPTGKTAPLGIWGANASPGVSASMLVVGATGATFQLDCARGSIGQPLVLDASGHFDLPGNIVNTSNLSGPSHAARYMGSLTGNTMTLIVGEIDCESCPQDSPEGEATELFGPFNLQLGVKPAFHVCG